MSILRKPLNVDMRVTGIGRPTSPWIRRVNYFIHGLLYRILPLYIRWCSFLGIEYQDYGKDDGIIVSSITAMPFNTVLKDGDVDRVREEEAMALRLAYAMGLPVPRVISYGDNGSYASIWMTRLPGRPLSEVWDTELSPEEQRAVALDIDACLSRLREYPNPAGSVTSSVSGGTIPSYICPFGKVTPAPDEDALIEQLVYWNFHGLPYTPGSNPEAEENYERAKDLVAAGPHRSILTHGDLYKWNMLVDNGRLSGIVDWECAGWMPEWWDIANLSLWEQGMPGSSWRREILATPSAAKYHREMAANNGLFALMQPWKR